MADFTFTYDAAKTHGQNFIEWRTLNSEERSAYSEAQLDVVQGKETFERMYGTGDYTVDNVLDI